MSPKSRTATETPSPIPRRVLALGLALIMALAVGHAWYGWQQAGLGLGLGGDQLNIGVMSQKLRQPTLYPNDYVFADTAFFSFYTPAFLTAAGWLTDLAGSYGQGLALLLFPVILLYTTGMWRLLQTFTGDWRVSLPLAIASAYLAESLGGTIWGVADLRLMIPRSLMLSLIPWWVWLWWHWRDRLAWWRRPLLGLLLGLLANLHPVSGLMLSQLFLLTELWWRRREWGRASFCLSLGVTALLLLAGVWPTASTFIRGSDLAGAAATAEDFRRFRQAMQFSFSTLFPFHSTWLQRWSGPAGQTVLVAWQLLLLAATAAIGVRGWPQPDGLAGTRRVLGDLARRWPALLLLAEMPLIVFLTDGGSPLLLLGLLLLALAMLWPGWGYRPEAPERWAIFLLVAVSSLALIGSFALEWIWNRWQWWALTSLVGEQARMAKFVYLPLYLLNGRLLAWAWSRLAPEGRLAPLCLGLATLLVAVHRPVAILLLFLLAAWFLATRHLRWPWPWLAGLLVLLVGLWLLTATFLWPLGWGQLLWVWLALVTVFWLWLRLIPSNHILSLASGLTFFLLAITWPLLPAGQPAAATLSPARYAEAQADLARRLDAQALYAWAAAETPVGAVFYVDSFEFRFYARRAITHSTRDWGTAYYQRTGLVALAERWQRLENAMASPASARAAAAEVGADYLYVDRRSPLRLDRPVAYNNDSYIVYDLRAP